MVRSGWAIFWSSILPWLLVIPFQTGWWLNMLINYVSLIFTSSSNFIIPFLLYFASKKYAARAEVVPDGPGDEYNLVLMDSTTSGRTLNSVHMGSAIPLARSSCSRSGSMLSRPGSMFSRSGSMFEPRSHHGSTSDTPISPIITIIPPEDTDTDPWDPRPSSPMHVIHPSPSHHSFSASLPTIVEPVKDSPADSAFVNSEDEKGSPRPLRPHGLKIIIPQHFLAPPLSTGTSPKRDHSPGSLSSSPRRESSFSCSYKRSSVESCKLTTDDPSTPSLAIPTLTVPQPSPTLTVDHSSSASPRLSVISMRSLHSRKSSSDSYITPSILVSMTADNHTAYLADGRISGMPPIPDDEVRLFRAFPETVWFNSVCYGWIATGLMTGMVVAVLVYDFVMLGLQGLQGPGS
ncbi:hypothetical protein BC936DRAFT_148302 [Jimgerdemannia flammicorona]|uniref:Amino acid transporter transmembrane domain-containing protein n=1 Tax=Jimgerdemannia flammicorona TaxID=994334 RepID=A0A433D3A5_9FUNG|nr:hypothetical protein BC936DRAFT_148302 [Jimgerdemannia flammicorona]